EEQQSQAGRLPHELQELGLPVLESGSEELRPEVRPLEHLPVLSALVALHDELGDELPYPGEQEQCSGHEAETIGLAESGLSAARVRIHDTTDVGRLLRAAVVRRALCHDQPPPLATRVGAH